MHETKLEELAWNCLVTPGGASFGHLELTTEQVLECFDVSDGKAITRDLNEAVSRAKKYLARAVIEPAVTSPSALFDALLRCQIEVAGTGQEELIGYALSVAHNSGLVDAVDAAIEAVSSGSDAFVVSGVLAEALPLFDAIELRELLRLFELIFPRTKGDLAQGELYGAVGRWMESRPSVVEQVIDCCLSNQHESNAQLLRAALASAVKLNKHKWLGRLLDLANGPNILVRRTAIETCGLIEWTCLKVPEVSQIVEAVKCGLRSADEGVVLSSVSAGMIIVANAADEEALLDEILALDKPYVARLVGNQFGYRPNGLPEKPWFWGKVLRLASKPTNGSGSFSGLDQLLVRLFHSGDVGRCTEWLNAWVSANSNDPPDFPKELPQLFASLQGQPRDIGELLARWLTHESVGVQKAARHVLNGIELSGKWRPIFPSQVLDDMTSNQLLHLVRRVLGNVISERQLISLIWSLASTSSAETRSFGLIHDAMVNFVGHDYPAATKEHLYHVVKDDSQSSLHGLANSILLKLKGYQDALNALPFAEELQPLADHRLRFAKERGRQMRAALDEATKGSIVQMIATRIPLKAGRSSFSVRNGEVGDRLSLSSISHSVSVPRSESIDRIGSDLQRIRFNLSKEGGGE